MTTQKQANNLAGKAATVCTIVFLIIVILLFARHNASAQQTGYFVVVTIDKHNEIIKTADKQLVLNLINQQFPGSNVNLDEALYRTKEPVFQMYAGYDGIYVEEKWIKKVRKNGKLKMKRKVNNWR